MDKTKYKNVSMSIVRWNGLRALKEKERIKSTANFLDIVLQRAGIPELTEQELQAFLRKHEKKQVVSAEAVAH